MFETTYPAGTTAAAPRAEGAPKDAADPVLLRWLIGLRWAVIGLLAATLPAGEHLLGFHVRYAIALPIVAAAAAYNAIAHARLRAGKPASERSVAAAVALDLFAIGAVLAASGGAANPFSAVFFVHVALAASLLPPRTTFVLAALATCLFAALFALPSGTCCPNHPTGEGFSAHLYGMWAAFVAAAALVTFFVTRVRRALDERSAAIERLERRAEEGARFAALGTLAAGTAHELATPLGTIAVLAGEIADQAGHDTEARAQAAAIGEQVRRCRGVIRSMQAGVASARGLDARGALDLRVAVARAVDAWKKANPEAPVTLLSDPSAPLAAALSSEDVEAAVCALLDNALFATRAASSQDPIVVAVEIEGYGAGERPIATSMDLAVRVDDSGSGVPPEIAGRLGEPFFTTKQPGEGMGMGLYLVRAWLAQVGGRLSVCPRAPRGTSVTLHLAGVRS